MGIINITSVLFILYQLLGFSRSYLLTQLFSIREGDLVPRKGNNRRYLKGREKGEKHKQCCWIFLYLFKLVTVIWVHSILVNYFENTKLQLLCQYILVLSVF